MSPEFRSFLILSAIGILWGLWDIYRGRKYPDHGFSRAIQLILEVIPELYIATLILEYFPDIIMKWVASFLLAGYSVKNFIRWHNDGKIQACQKKS